jgi:CRP-like cAMP-binding protein
MCIMLIETFDQFFLFKDLSDEQLELIQPLFTICEGPSGSQLFEQGDLADFLYLVVDGQVSIRYKPDDGPEILVTHVGNGGVVGWSALLGNRVYTSGAICTSQCQLVRVRGAELRDLCEHHSETGVVILERLAAVIAERLRNTHDEIFKLLKQGVGSSVDAC